jgi:hypothetical protein
MIGPEPFTPDAMRKNVGPGVVTALRGQKRAAMSCTSKLRFCRMARG